MMNALPDPNLSVAFEARVLADPSAPALVVEDREWTRGEIADMAARATARLLAFGVQTGDRVVAQYDTSAEDIALALATARLGGVFMPIPKRLGVREINYLLDKSQARLFAHAEGFQLSGISLPSGVAAMATPTLLDAEPVSIPAPVPAPDEVAVIGVTSGSTGNPKGVMHSWSGVAWAAERVRALADVRDGESILVTGAGAGAPGFTLFTYHGLAHGATIVRARRWEPVSVLRLARERRCVWTTMVPTMLQMLIDARAEALGEDRLEHMRAATLGGSFISPALIRRARSELGMEVLRMYAMAECMCNASMQLTDSVEERDSFDGRPASGAELGVFDETGGRLPAGVAGEVGLRGPSLLKGYLSEPDGKSRLMTPDGFFLSGDIGKLTKDGFMKIVGRKKDMIIRGGYNIDPSEVEELIKRHPAVSKVAVVGYPDQVFGERACAVVEPVSSSELELRELIDFLLSLGLSKEKLPERLECWPELPLSPDGKILKAKIRSVIGTNPSSDAV